MHYIKEIPAHGLLVATCVCSLPCSPGSRLKNTETFSTEKRRGGPGSEARFLVAISFQTFVTEDKSKNWFLVPVFVQLKIESSKKNAPKHISSRKRYTVSWLSLHTPL